MIGNVGKMPSRILYVAQKALNKEESRTVRLRNDESMQNIISACRTSRTECLPTYGQTVVRAQRIYLIDVVRDRESVLTAVRLPKQFRSRSAPSLAVSSIDVLVTNLGLPG